MKISLNTKYPLEKMKFSNGFGYGTEQIWNSLHRLGYDVQNNRRFNADVELFFDQPYNYNWYSQGATRVSLFPWESTEVHPKWIKSFMWCHEVWTPSPIVADWLRDIGLPQVYVYEHGVDSIWKPNRRKVEDKIKFLHVGGEALRKGWQRPGGTGPNVVDAFKAAFANRNDVELTLKMNYKGAEGLNPYPLNKNINVINGIISVDELVDLYQNHHAFVYPSWGEGFGFNPLQAMATGMPTICTSAWAPYASLLDPSLSLDSILVDSPWPKVHPGKMFQPDFDQLVDTFRYLADNYESCSDFAMRTSAAVHIEYDWDALTSKAFTALEERLIFQGKLS